MKIRLVNYPYLDYEIGDVVDLGEVKNRSMVSIQRAVWEEEKPEPKKKKGGKKNAKKPKIKSKPSNKIRPKKKNAKKPTEKEGFWEKLDDEDK